MYSRVSYPSQEHRGVSSNFPAVQTAPTDFLDHQELTTAVASSFNRSLVTSPMAWVIATAFESRVVPKVGTIGQTSSLFDCPSYIVSTRPPSPMIQELSCGRCCAAGANGCLVVPITASTFSPAGGDIEADTGMIPTWVRPRMSTASTIGWLVDKATMLPRLRPHAA